MELTVDGRGFDCIGSRKCDKFGVGDFQLKDGCKCGYQISLLLEAGDGAADREEVISVGDCLCQGIHDVATLDGKGSKEYVIYSIPSKWTGNIFLWDTSFS